MRFAARGGWSRRALPPTVAFILLLASCAVQGEGRISSPAPDRGGVLRLAQQAAGSLDPAESTSVYESLPVNQIFDGLLEIDNTLSIVPRLASAWSVSRDGLTYTFHLRPDVRFHDGTPMTAEDVLYTFRRLLSPGRANANVAASHLCVVRGAAEYARGVRPDLPGVQAPDRGTVRILLDRPDPTFLGVLAMDGAQIVPRHVVEAMGDATFGRSPVGTGPFRFVARDEDGLHLEANPEYFAGPPWLDRLDIVFLDASEEDLGVARFEGGELDVVEVPEKQLGTLVRDPRVRVFRYQEMSLSFLGLQTTERPLDDVRIRQAIAHAIDREAIAADSPMQRRIANGILPPGLTGYTPRPKAIERDPKRARELLAEAGYPDGRGLPPLELYVAAGNPTWFEVPEQVLSALSAVGIRVLVRRVAWEELNRRVDEGKAPAFLITWVADLNEPDIFLSSLFRSGGPANFFGLRDESLDTLLETGSREVNPVQRAKVYARAERRAAELGALVPLYHSVSMLAMREGVHGLEPGPLGLASVDFEKVWLDGPGESS